MEEENVKKSVREILEEDKNNMILKIHQSKYYGYQNKNKELFKKHYRSLGLKWKESVNLDGVLSDGWYNNDNSVYLLKLPEDGEYKKFTGNSDRMFMFLKSIGAIEYEGDEKGVHIDYSDSKGFITQHERYGYFIGGDLISHYRTEELLKDMPANWDVNWGYKKVVIVNDVKSNIKKRVIIRRKINDNKV